MVATCVISIEVELGWGTHDLKNFDHLSDSGKVEREFLDRLLSIADRYSTPVTFNVVGELFNESNDARDKSVYPDGWLESQTEELGLFWAPDMVDAIEAAEMEHEVCTHTQSHILFDEMSTDVAEAELEQVQQAHTDRFGSETESLVPPRHQKPDTDLLDKHGIEIVRLAHPLQSNTRPGRFWELAYGLPIVHTPRIIDGVVQTYVTRHPSLTVPTLPRGQSEPHKVFDLLPESVRESLYRQGIKRTLDQASRTDQAVHLWCHVFDLSAECQLQHIESLFEMLQTRNDVEVLTMAQLNQKVRQG